MRRLAFTLLLLAFAAAFATAKDESVDELKARFQNARPDERADLGIRIAQRQLHNADTLYRDGKMEEARAAVDDLVIYAEKARDGATQSGKRMKNVEIDARKIADKLRDIKRTLPADDQPPVEQAIRRLEDVRTILLKEMFANKKEKQ